MRFFKEKKGLWYTAIPPVFKNRSFPIGFSFSDWESSILNSGNNGRQAFHQNLA